MPESESPTDRRPKFCRPLAERKTSSVGASARRPVRALDRRVIPLSVEDQDFSVVRNGFWGRASRQGYFGIPVFHQVLVKRGHVGISCASLLRLRPQYQAEYDRLCEEG